MFTAIVCLNSRQSEQEPQYFAFFLDCDRYYFDLLEKGEIENYQTVELPAKCHESTERRFKLIGAIMEGFARLNGPYPVERIEPTIAAYEVCELGVLECTLLTIEKRLHKAERIKAVLGDVTRELAVIEKLIDDNNKAL